MSGVEMDEGKDHNRELPSVAARCAAGARSRRAQTRHIQLTISPLELARPTTMALSRGKPEPISDDLRWAVVRMSEQEMLDVETISRYTGISTRQILRILALWRSSGTVRREVDVSNGRRGRKRQLTMDDVRFLQLEHAAGTEQDDRYLEELREMLETATADARGDRAQRACACPVHVRDDEEVLF
ncbi:hypothetical protein OH77DRAFT_1238735 [Trametes cingulata]|nr:hypothetical protein OH77DRAFT_1238735 [Trametes cingulata]